MQARKVTQFFFAEANERNNSILAGIMDFHSAMTPSLQPTNIVASDPNADSRRDEKIEPSSAAISDLGASAELRLAAATGKGPKLDPEEDAAPTKAKWKTSTNDGHSGEGRGDAASPKEEKDKTSKEKKEEEDDDDESDSSDDEDEYGEGVEVFPVEGGGKYRDYSHATLRSDPVASIFAAASSKDPTFPVKLHQILSTGEFEDIIAWLPHGRAFRVLQPKAFEEKVIPLFFRHGRYASFARQVNGWGFHRITNGPDYGSYYHELFLRGCPHLCERMRRPQPGGPRKSRKEISSEPSPNFYEISEKAPLPELPPRPEPSASLSVPPGGAAASAVVAPGFNGTADAAAAAMASQQAAAFPFQAAGMAAGFGVFPGAAAGLPAGAATLPFLQNMQGMGAAPSMPQAAAGGLPSQLHDFGAAGLGLPGMQNMYAAQGLDMQRMAAAARMGGMAGQANLLGAAAAGYFPGQQQQQPQQQKQQQGNDGNGQGGNAAQNQNNGGTTPQWNAMRGTFR